MGEIIGRFERKGFTLRALKLFRPSKELAEEHYKDLSAKPFFKDLVEYITSGPVVAMVRSSSVLRVACVQHGTPFPEVRPCYKSFPEDSHVWTSRSVGDLIF